MTGLQILDGTFRIVGTQHRSNRVLFGNSAQKAAPGMGVNVDPCTRRQQFVPNTCVTTDHIRPFGPRCTPRIRRARRRGSHDSGAA